MKRGIPLSIPTLKGNEWRYIKDCVKTGWISAGKFVDDFEKEVAKYTKAHYAVSCINGTSGLQVALRLAGVKPQDEVIVPTLTFIASVNAIRYLYAEPVFMDCDDYMNIDTKKVLDFCKNECVRTKNGLKNKKTKRIVRGIMPVHIFGNPCNMEEIMKIARRYNLSVIEDATESIGSYYTEGVYRGRFTGTIGDFGVYSFNANKIITSGGGGMIVTNNEKMAAKLHYLISQAKDDPVHYIHNDIGYNFRLSNLHSSLGLAQLRKLEDFIKTKERNYLIYKKEFVSINGIRLLDIPPGTRPNYWFYSLIIEKEKFGMDIERLITKLRKNGIEVRPIWYLNHMQKPYRKNQAYMIEKALWFWKRTINIPCSTNLTKQDILKVTSYIKGMK